MLTGVCVCCVCTGGSATGNFVEGVSCFDVHVVSAKAGLVEEEGSICGGATLERYSCGLGGTRGSRGRREGEFADFTTKGEEVSKLLGGGDGGDVGDVDSGTFGHGDCNFA